MVDKKEETRKLLFQINKNVFLYEGKNSKISQDINIPFINVEQCLDSEGEECSKKLGQIHMLSNHKVVFHNHLPMQQILDKEELVYILEGIKYIEKYVEEYFKKTN